MAAVDKATMAFLSSECKKSFKQTGKVPSLALGNGKSVSGVSSIAKHLQRTKTKYGDLCLEKRMEVEQWIEFATTNVRYSVSSSDKTVLKELNHFLQNRAYFVAERLTLADIIMFHYLHPLIAELSFHEKEMFVHVSRWFLNMQQEKNACQSLQPVTFLRTQVYNGIRAH